MKSKRKAQRQQQRATPAPPGRSGSRLRYLLLTLAVLLTAAGTWALFEYVIWNVTPPELVGSWVVVRGPADQQGAIFEFFRNGTMIGHIDPEGARRIVNARI